MQSNPSPRIDVKRVLPRAYEAAIGLLGHAEIASVVIFYTYLCTLFARHYMRRRHVTVFFVVACQVIYLAAVANDSFVGLRVYPFIYVSEFVFFIIILGMAYALLNDFVHLHHANEELNTELENKVAERTREIETLNEHLRHQAERDGLTGVYNRRFFNEYFVIELRRAEAYFKHGTNDRLPTNNEMNFGLAIIDIDHFKEINDCHGHQTGDRLLQEIVDIIERNIFARDVLCRYGGDEFALLLTKTSAQGILQALEKICGEIEAHEFLGDDGVREPITISVGVVNFGEMPGSSCEKILRVADNRLLQAKRIGRNRVVSHD